MNDWKMSSSRRTLEKAIAEGKVVRNPTYNPNEIWVPLAIDETIPDSPSKLTDIFIEHGDYLHCILANGGFGELSPQFTSEVSDYCTTHMSNIAFNVLAVHTDIPHAILICIDPDKLKIRNKKVYIKDSDTELIFVPRLINYERLIGFDAYPVGTNINWSRIRDCDMYPLPD